MKMKIKHMKPYKIAYIRQVGAYGANNVETMERLKAWARSNALFTKDAVILGIAHDNPENTAPEDCRYDACIVISDDFQIKKDENICLGVIAGGDYAVFTIEHTKEALAKAWSEIFVVLEEQKYIFEAERCIFERYTVEMVLNEGCEICVPVNRILRSI